MKRTVCAGLAAAGLLAAAPALALNLCVEGAYPPFSEVAPDGSIVGFDIDIGQALCAEMGETCELVKVDWDGIIPALLEKKCDAIVASMSATEERKQVIDFIAKYYQLPNRFVAKADAGLTDTPEGMAGKVVGVQRGTIHQDYMEAHYPDTELRLYASQDEANLDLAAGRVDALMADTVSLEDGFLEDRRRRGLRLLRRREPLRPGDPRQRRRRSACARRTPSSATGSPRRSTRSAPTAATRRSPSSTSASTSTAADASGGAGPRRRVHGQPAPLRADPGERRAGDHRARAAVAGARDPARRARRRRAARRRPARPRRRSRLHHRSCAACPTS